MLPSILPTFLRSDSNIIWDRLRVCWCNKKNRPTRDTRHKKRDKKDHRPSDKYFNNPGHTKQTKSLTPWLAWPDSSKSPNLARTCRVSTLLSATSVAFSAKTKCPHQQFDRFCAARVVVGLRSSCDSRGTCSAVMDWSTKTTLSGHSCGKLVLTTSLLTNRSGSPLSKTASSPTNNG